MSSSVGGKQKPKYPTGMLVISLEHYVRVLMHRWWVVVGTFLVVSAGTWLYAHSLPDIFTSETVILVDPQKVPESYVKSTVTGDVRNRLGTLSQQILSVSRLQKIIERLNLYPEERKKLAREDVILAMRNDIGVRVLSDFGNGQDLEAFRITYSGQDPRTVAQVANELASLFIEENLRSREQQATGTTEFLQNQLTETRKALEAQEAQIKNFKLQHVGEMPEQQTANVQILGQLQQQLQVESEALSRAEQQRTYLQSLGAQSAPVVDLDGESPRPPAPPKAAPAQGKEAPLTPLDAARARLQALRERYKEDHPDIIRAKRQLAEEEAKSAAAGPSRPVTVPSAPEPEPATVVATRRTSQPANYVNPVLQSQLASLESEIAKHKEEQQRLSKSIANYRVKLEAIPVREQQISQLLRDYEINKTHYAQLLDKQLSAETATQLEIRQKGEKFTVLDPAQVAERPTRPNRALIDMAGCAVGLGLGLLIALITEFFGITITEPAQVLATAGVPVLEVIPRIRTAGDRMRFRRRLMWAAMSGAATVVVGLGLVAYRYRSLFL